jgi:hypothetical protein
MAPPVHFVESRLAADPQCWADHGNAMVSVRGPGKKLRGGRRYYRHLRSWPDSVKVTFGPDHWYDLWHQHPDFQGWSTSGGRAHQAHLAVLFQAFHRVLAQAAEYDGPAQVFVCVHTKDTAGDALYVHTPNLNSANFPYRFESYRWEGVQIPEWLLRYINPEVQVGETVFEGERRYVVAPRGPRGRPTRG